MKKSLLVAMGIGLLFFSIGNGDVYRELWAVARAAVSGGNIADAEKGFAGVIREVTAYNVGVMAQTSATPCIGASGQDLCRLVKRGVKVCAANFVPIGTTLHIEGIGEHIVLDRMHSRFSHRVDIAMREDEVGKALEFGVQRRIVEAK